MSGLFDEEIAAQLRGQIARKRARKGALAHAAGINQGTLSQILSGARPPTTRMLHILCRLLEISPSDVVRAAEQAEAKSPVAMADEPAGLPRTPARSPDVVASSTILPRAIIDDLNAALREQDPDEVDRVLARARDFGWALRPLGEALGVTRERARQRIQRFEESGLPPSEKSYPTEPSRAAKEAERATQRIRRARINGFRLNDPILRLPVATLTSLARLSELATSTRTWTPMDAPERRAIEPYKEMLIELTESGGISKRSLERALGYQYRTIHAWLARHGHGDLHPSQSRFKGVHVSEIERQPTEARRTIVLGGHCRQGHLITEENMLRNGSIGYICGTCRKERSAAAYQARKAAMKGAD